MWGVGTSSYCRCVYPARGLLVICSAWLLQKTAVVDALLEVGGEEEEDGES